MSTTVSQTSRTAGFRSLDEETHLDSVPVTGTVPPWLQGSLVRVTPALMDGGGKTIKHWFDGAAMLNDVGFGADPCRSLFKRVMSINDVNKFDNANVNLQELGRRYIAMTETPLPVEFDPKTLATIGKPKWPDKA